MESLMLTSRTVGALVVLLALPIVSGCTADTPEPTSPSASRANVGPAASSSAAPTAGAPVTLDRLPAEKVDGSTVATVSPRTGPHSIRAAVPKGYFWVGVHCVGRSIVIVIDDVARLPYKCKADEIGPTYGAEIELAAPKKLTIRVEPGDAAVQWSMRVGLGGGNAGS